MLDRKSTLLLLLSLTMVALIVVTCDRDNVPQELAEKHCASCHLYPAPELLDKRSWEKGIFPEMAFRMGRDISKLPATDPDELNQILQAIPSSALVSQEEWELIQRYYLEHAPDSLHTADIDPSRLRQFTASTFNMPISGNTSLTTIRFDAERNKMWVGTRQGKLFKFSPAFIPEDSIQLNGPPSDLIFDKEKIYATVMGIMDPNDQPAGSVVEIHVPGHASKTLVDSMKRPVDLVYTDINRDQKKDFVVSGFGNFTGGLYAHEEKNGKYITHPIHNFSGNRKCEVADLNRDGLPDIMALLAQGDERIALFTNRGNYQFSYQVLLRFPPVYGSSYFELFDFNADGYADILYTNGDNADYSPVLKPYHGVRIFLNDGKNHFSEARFYPMHGASMARAADFDEDGDVDIAAISFFPDFSNHSDHSFIYLENVEGKFTPYMTPLASAARWITMESADIDDDGDKDIVLAALNFPDRVPETLVKRWRENPVSLLVLRNNLVE